MATEIGNMPWPPRYALSFDDVLLVPKRTRVRSRKQVDLTSRLTPRIQLRIPIVSANTPWCTQSEMASEMARLGAFGVIHRMQLATAQVQEVRRVKQAPTDPEQRPNATVGADGRLLVGAAVGIKGDFLERAALLVEEGVDVLVVDVAHGHSDDALNALEELKSAHPQTEIIAGNVATAEAVNDLVAAGADAVKVGIGPGGVCTTRLVAGCGVPQITAIRDCVAQAAPRGVPVIADGGIRYSGDLTKALAVGASTVMLGSLLAGVDESAAMLVELEGRKFKVSTGFVSLGMELTLKRCAGEAITEEELREYVPEGVEATFDYKGPLKDHLHQLAGGLRSGLSYCGAVNLSELRSQAELVQMSPAGMAESRPHVLSMNEQLQLELRQRLGEGAQARGAPRPVRK